MIEYPPEKFAKSHKIIIEMIIMKLITKLTLLLLTQVTGCSHLTSVAESHAKTYVFHTRDDFDPNYKTNIADTIRLMPPFF